MSVSVNALLDTKQASDPAGFAQATGAASASPTTMLKSRRVATADTNSNNIKASAGNLYGYIIANPSAAVKFVKFYDKASAPTVGTDTPILTIAVPAGQTIFFISVIGVPFTLGLGQGITGAAPDADVTALVAGDIIITTLYA